MEADSGYASCLAPRQPRSKPGSQAGHTGLAARRPASIVAGIADKFKSAAGHPGWVQDSSANYVFGRFGTGLEAAHAALARCATSGKPLSVLDAGCGSGGHLVQILKLASEHGVTVFLRGLTAEKNAVAPELTGCLEELPEADMSGDAEDAVDAPLPAVRIYYSVPLEDLAVLHGLDFIRNGELFDLILCSWTLLHLCDPLGTLLQLRSLLHPEGILLSNGLWFHVKPSGSEVEEGSMEAMQQLLARLPPSLQHDFQGEDVRWVPVDPEDQWSDGEFQGGFKVSICWLGGSAPAQEVVSDAATVASFVRTGDAVLDKLWHLESGPQYQVAAYELS